MFLFENFLLMKKENGSYYVVITMCLLNRYFINRTILFNNYIFKQTGSLFLNNMSNLRVTIITFFIKIVTRFTDHCHFRNFEFCMSEDYISIRLVITHNQPIIILE